MSTDDIEKVILSHLHSDHIGGLRHVSQAQWLISKVDAHGHAGALMCRIPAHNKTQYIQFNSEPFGGFQQSFSVNVAGDIRIVPTPGHTKGHQSVMVDTGEWFVLLAGDVVFDKMRLDSGRAIAGIVEDIDAAKLSINAIENQIKNFPTLVLTAHDVNAVQQLLESRIHKR